ncbi:MAG TPA: universal stress protein [Nocardioidaceae bacterium]|nr:universal stress protein [Nocardioidaceae bacterium]
MNEATSNGVIAVGIDGSEGSLRALQWAVDEGRLRRCAVEAVTAWPPRGVDIDLTEEQAADARRRADETQRHQLDTVVREGHDTPPLSSEVVRGDAVEVLVRTSERAQLLVIGSHGTMSMRHAALGSVSEACATRAACPVVVVPTRPAADAPHDAVARP